MPGQYLARHAHANVTVGLPLQGAFEEVIHRESHAAAPGMVLVKPAEFAHSNQFGPLGARSLLIDVLPSRAVEIGEVSKVLDGPLVLRVGPWRRAAAELVKAWSENGTTSPLVIEGLVLELIGRLSDTEDSLTDCVAPTWLKRAHEFLFESSNSPLTLSAIAREVGVHPVHLARSFRTYYGRSIGECQREQRLSKALQLLKDSQATLAEIAQKAGFADQSHFTRAFRKYHGVTPGAYRARYFL